MFHHLLQEVLLHRIDDVKEILSRRTLTLRKYIGKVLRHICIALELRPEGLDGQFIILRHLNIDNILFTEQLLLVTEHLLEEIFVQA